MRPLMYRQTGYIIIIKNNNKYFTEIILNLKIEVLIKTDNGIEEKIKYFTLKIGKIITENNHDNIIGNINNINNMISNSIFLRLI